MSRVHSSKGLGCLREQSSSRSKGYLKKIENLGTLFVQARVLNL